MQEMYTIRFKPAAEVKDKWDLFTTSRAGARREPEPRADRADARGQQLHDAAADDVRPREGAAPAHRDGATAPSRAARVSRTC